MNLDQAKNVLLRTHVAAIKAGERASGMYLESGPGIGKSETEFEQVAELAATLNEPCGLVQEMLATAAGPDVRGFMLPVKGADGSLDSMFSVPFWYPKVANTWVVEPDGTWHMPGTWKGDLPRYGDLFLDEFAQAEDEVKKPAAELILRGTVGTTTLPQGWRVVAAGNRTSDRSGVMREMMFIVNRRCRLSIDASLPAWLGWANRQEGHKRPHYLSVSFAQRNPDLVFRDAVPAGTDPFCTPRTLCLMDKDLRALRTDEEVATDRMPMDGVAKEVAAGWIGQGEAAQFYTHLRYADELPDLADIERNPATAKLPAGRDAQMVCGYMLAHSSTEHNIKKIWAYLLRLNIEMQILVVKNFQGAKGADNLLKALFALPAYMEWLTRHKEVITASRS